MSGKRGKKVDVGRNRKLKSRTVKAEQGGKFTGYVRLRLVVPVAEV